MPTRYATPENDGGYVPDLHIKGTVKRPNSISFWMTRPRPEGVSIDDWDKLETEKWNRIFGVKDTIKEAS